MLYPITASLLLVVASQAASPPRKGHESPVPSQRAATVAGGPSVGFARKPEEGSTLQLQRRSSLFSRSAAPPAPGQPDREHAPATDYAGFVEDFRRNRNQAADTVQHLLNPKYRAQDEAVLRRLPNDGRRAEAAGWLAVHDQAHGHPSPRMPGTESHRQLIKTYGLPRRAMPAL